jgi:hypothetical protein
MMFAPSVVTKSYKLNSQGKQDCLPFGPGPKKLGLDCGVRPLVHMRTRTHTHAQKV